MKMPVKLPGPHRADGGGPRGGPSAPGQPRRRSARSSWNGCARARTTATRAPPAPRTAPARHRAPGTAAACAPHSPAASPAIDQSGDPPAGRIERDGRQLGQGNRLRLRLGAESHQLREARPRRSGPTPAPRAGRPDRHRRGSPPSGRRRWGSTRRSPQPRSALRNGHGIPRSCSRSRRGPGRIRPPGERRGAAVVRLEAAPRRAGRGRRAGRQVNAPAWSAG